MSVTEVIFSLTRSHNDASIMSYKERSLQENSRMFPDLLERSRAKSMGDPDIRSKDTHKPVAIRKLGISAAQKTKSRMQLELLMKDFQKLSIQPTAIKAKPLITKTNIVRKPLASSIFQASSSSNQNSSVIDGRRVVSLEHEGCKICNEVTKDKLTDHAIQRVYLMAHGRIMPKDMLSKVHKTFDQVLGNSSTGSNTGAPGKGGPPGVNRYYNPKSLNVDQELEKLFKPLNDGQIYDPRITKTEKSSLPSLADFDSVIKKETAPKTTQHEVSKISQQAIISSPTQIDLPQELAGLQKLRTVDPVEILAALRDHEQLKNRLQDPYSWRQRSGSKSRIYDQPHQAQTVVSLANLEVTDISLAGGDKAQGRDTSIIASHRLATRANTIDQDSGVSTTGRLANMREVRQQTKEILTRAMSKDTYRTTSRMLERVLLPKKDTSGYYLCELQDYFENRFNAKMLNEAKRHLSHFIDTLKQLKSGRHDTGDQIEEQLIKLKKMFHTKYSLMVRNAETAVNPPRPKKVPYSVQVMQYLRTLAEEEEQANSGSSNRQIQVDNTSKPSEAKSPQNDSGTIVPPKLVKFDEKVLQSTKQKKPDKDPEEITNWLFLDLDETLISSTLLPASATEFTFMLSFHDGSKKKYNVQMRPFLREFLERLSDLYHLVVYTSSQKSYAEKVVEYIDPQDKFFKAVLASDFCLKVENSSTTEVVLTS